ncbi:hypothetical protein QAD02_018281 [Eretmocerus hayati]|uniref:Uncharacterized protein n=1 Tax=Eretmocerus hayati TaxID=131215 RepID=A0ACC2PIS8_9HYME|nr:hypothetical protein QAD02_018281 [Eretmocerus hayati]
MIQIILILLSPPATKGHAIPECRINTNLREDVITLDNECATHPIGSIRNDIILIETSHIDYCNYTVQIRFNTTFGSNFEYQLELKKIGDDGNQTMIDLAGPINLEPTTLSLKNDPDNLKPACSNLIFKTSNGEDVGISASYAPGDDGRWCC